MSIAKWIEEALTTTKSQECSIFIEEVHQVNLRWAATALTTNGQSSQCTATVISYKDQLSGCATQPVASVADVIKLVQRADAACQEAMASADAMPLPEPRQDANFEQPAQPKGPEVFASLTQQLGQAFQVAKQKGHLLYGFAEYEHCTRWLGDTKGNRLRSQQPGGRFEFTAKMPDMINSAYVGQFTLDFSDVDVSAHHEELMRRLEWGKNKIELPAGRYETILSPSATVDMIYPLSWEFSYRNAMEGANCFAAEKGTKRGHKYSQLPFTYISDPKDPRFPTHNFVATASSLRGHISVFDNGAQLGKTEWFKDGVLTNLIATRADVAEYNLEGGIRADIDNMILDAKGEATIEEMIASTKRGLLVTCLWYIRTVDPQTLLQTGLTRDGVYLIEDGEIKGLVNNFRWNESPLELLGRCTEVSRSEITLCREWNDWFIRSVAPAMRIPDFNMSTISQAV